jgi:high-affinity Fe2+/Pb2+ permease
VYNWFLIDVLKKWLSGRAIGRMVIAVITGIALTSIVAALIVATNHRAAEGIAGICMCILPAIIAVSVYHKLLLRSGWNRPDRETHCRKCRYILRGISEPRCPECGERI